MLKPTLETATQELYSLLSGNSHPPSHRAFLVDTSYSMKGTKITEAKKALTKNVQPSDKIITFGSTVQVVAFQNIFDIEPDGETAMLPAIKKAVEGLSTHLILISDGNANEGGDAYECLDYVTRLNKIVKIDTIAIGNDCDVDLLQGLAKISGGSTYSVNDPLQLTGVMGLICAPNQAIQL
jgi:Mg-chelatase subunit ChlD